MQTSLLSLEWSSFRWKDDAGDWCVLRFAWARRTAPLRNCPLLFVRVAAPSNDPPWPGVVVAGEDGAVAPPLAGDRFALPGPALSAPFYVFIPSEQVPSEPFFVQVVLITSPAGDDELAEYEVDVSAAWERPPAEWAADLRTAARLLATGGKTGERQGYVRLMVEALAQVEHPQVASLQLALDSPHAIAELPQELRPLARAGAVLELARRADLGDQLALERGLAALPAAIREVPSVAALRDVAKAAAQRPDAPSRRLLAEAHEARRSGQHARCIEICDRVPPRGPAGAEAAVLRLHAAADLIEGALKAADKDSALALFHKFEADFVQEVGERDPWLQSVRTALGQSGDADDLEEAQVVEAPLERINVAARAVWARVQNWLKPQWEEPHDDEPPTSR